MTSYLPVVNNVISIVNNQMLSSYHEKIYNVNSLLDASNNNNNNNEYCLSMGVSNAEGNRNQMIEFDIFFNNRSSITQIKINNEYYPMTLNIRNTNDNQATFFSQSFCIVNRNNVYIIMSKMYAWK